MAAEVICQTCRSSWPLAGAWTVYRQGELESRPCPRCGGYTLTSPEPKPTKPARPNRPSLQRS